MEIKIFDVGMELNNKNSNIKFTSYKLGTSENDPIESIGKCGTRT